MQCPFCKTDDSRVIDTRVTDGGSAVRRRRECIKCSKRFTTYEKPETALRLMVIKKDGSRVPYERAKVLAGLQKACYKRPVGEAQLEEAADKIEERIIVRFDREVPSKFIGEQAADVLRDLDQVAYVRFASVYHEFRDVGEFIEEARGIMNGQDRELPGQKKLFDENEKE